MRAHLLPGLGFALLYWAVGYPAIHLAIPPGYTAPFFPPAGIALAALFVFGLRLWPAVFAGSALIQLATAWPLLGSLGWSLLGPSPSRQVPRCRRWSAHCSRAGSCPPATSSIRPAR